MQPGLEPGPRERSREMEENLSEMTRSPDSGRYQCNEMPFSFKLQLKHSAPADPALVINHRKSADSIYCVINQFSY